MNIVDQYIFQFMSKRESAEAQNPFQKELDKLKGLMDPFTGAEVKIRLAKAEEVPTSMDPRTGYVGTHNAEEDAEGYLNVEKENGLWSWQTSVHIESGYLDFNDSGKGFETLDACLKSFADYVFNFDDFEVLE